MANNAPARAPAKELSSINFESMLGGPLVAVVNAQAKAAMSSVNFIKQVGFKPGSSEDPQASDTGEPIYVTFKYPKEVKPYEPEVEPGITGITITDGGSGYESAPAVTFSAGNASAHTVVTDGVVTSIVMDDYGTGYTTAPTATIAAPTGDGGSTATVSVDFRQGKEASAAKFQTMKLEVPILTMLPIPFIRIEETTIDFNAKINSVEEAKSDSTFKIDTTLDANVKYPPLFSIASVNLKVNTSYQRNTSSGYKVDRTYSMAVHIRAVQDEMPAGMEKILSILEDSITSQPQGETATGTG